eukprot:5308403-Pyramimonas_sp.AAC.1
MVQFVRLQMHAVFGDPTSSSYGYVYQLGFRARYIGKCRAYRSRRAHAGFVYRLREHWRDWQLTSRKELKARAGRYDLMLRMDGPEFYAMVVSSASQDQLLPLEA